MRWLGDRADMGRAPIDGDYSTDCKGDPVQWTYEHGFLCSLLSGREGGVVDMCTSLVYSRVWLVSIGSPWPGKCFGSHPGIGVRVVEVDLVPGPFLRKQYRLFCHRSLLLFGCCLALCWSFLLFALGFSCAAGKLRVAQLIRFARGGPVGRPRRQARALPLRQVARTRPEGIRRPRSTGDCDRRTSGTAERPHRCRRAEALVGGLCIAIAVVGSERLAADGSLIQPAAVG